MKDKTQTAASYILEYSQSIQALNDHTSIYINLMLELTAKYGKGLEKLETEAQNKLNICMQNLRHYCNKVMLMYEAIYSIDKLKIDKKIKEAYQYILNNYGLDKDKVREFTVLINKSFFNEVVQDLLTTSKELVEKIYNNG